ncbi:archaeo-eukaryotic primase superfamily helicase [Burkholderia phage BcepF1]|uniref:Archaeo-eukaryotic primase superfamily helicase n=1 Tax=Burkholderia phage BcepF1 TaxID=2886897 RepID=A1YZW7_9CAUD|nr:DNA primase [Burkholderia phage BcepF1]ABL96794.1 archaeo-eukaryotic primase superfamily helicase [Burkholderia phage BcepF1]
MTRKKDSQKELDAGPVDNAAPDDELDISLEDESADLTVVADKEARANILSVVDRKNATANEAENIRQNEPNLIKRAKALAALQAINWDDVKWIKSGDEFVSQPVSCDMNRIAVFKALFGEGKQRPHFDEFVGRVVDHRGEIIDDHYPAVDLLQAVSAAGMKQQSAKVVRDTIREYALTLKRNDMVQSLVERIPEWDGVPRLDTLMIDLFKPFETELNRKVSRYFFTSLYARLMHPGSFAPLVVFLIGGQNAGKSHFGRLICQYVLNDKDADSMPLDLAGNKNEFLREITGQSVIAQIGEMTGFTKGDLNKIKDFITRTSDNLNYKFEGNIQQPRQWVCLMDGNSYDGLNRDDTGNRRFYPFFVAQKPDEGGQPQWDKEFTTDFSNFETDFWQVLSEARMFYESLGQKGYIKFVNDVVRDVKNFNHSEMVMDRGTIRDDKLDIVLLPAIRGVKMRVYQGRGTNVRHGMVIDPAELFQRLSSVYRFDVNFKHLEPKMTALGFEKIVGGGNRKFFLYEGAYNEEEVHRRLGIIDDELPTAGEQEHEGF